MTKNPKGDLTIIDTTTGMDPAIIDTLAENHKAIVILSHANGAISQHLRGAIRRAVDSGTPIFILPDNARYNHGVVRYTDVPQVTLRDAGATMLETMNINNVFEVAAEIQVAIKAGLEGTELERFVREKHAYPEGQKPVSRLGDPEAFAAFQAKVEKEIGEGATE